MVAVALVRPLRWVALRTLRVLTGLAVMAATLLGGGGPATASEPPASLARPAVVAPTVADDAAIAPESTGSADPDHVGDHVPFAVGTVGLGAHPSWRLVGQPPVSSREAHGDTHLLTPGRRGPPRA